MTIDYRAIQDSLTSADAFLAQCDEPQVFGAKKKAVRALEIWNSGTNRRVWAYSSFRIPGGTGTGLKLGLLWDPAVVEPDLEAIATEVAMELDAKVITRNEKEIWKARDGKQNIFFQWRGIRDTELSRWLQARFGVIGFVSQVFSPSDFTENVAVAVDHEGTDRVWLSTTATS